MLTSVMGCLGNCSGESRVLLTYIEEEAWLPYDKSKLICFCQCNTIPRCICGVWLRSLYDIDKVFADLSSILLLLLVIQSQEYLSAAHLLNI